MKDFAGALKECVEKLERAHDDDVADACLHAKDEGVDEGRVDGRTEVKEDVAAGIQQVFAKHGPERDRHTDWLRCTDEPWFSLAGIFRADGR